MNDRLNISKHLWRALILDLRRRGEANRESGAFLLAPPGRRDIAAYVCYDDLDSSALDEGIIVFHGAGYVPLWDLCLKRQLRVVADVHTHPDSWTGQSHADRTHPMIGTPGHVALIVPYFAGFNEDSFSGVGMYRYRGNHRWEDRTKKALIEFHHESVTPVR
jgi:proteasome lid subunit RPN8/RPN11